MLRGSLGDQLLALWLISSRVLGSFSLSVGSPASS